MEPTANITLHDVAAACGVSQSLVSRVLRGDERYASSATAERIKEAARSLGYDPSRHHSARRLVHSRSKQQVINNVVALYFPTDFYLVPYFCELYRGLFDTFRQQRYGVLIDGVRGREFPQTELPVIVRRGDVDAVVFSHNPSHFMPMLSRLRAEVNFGNRPIVSVVNPIEGCSTVMADDRTGGYLLLRHLLELGHRRILQIVWTDFSLIYSLREDGYRQAFREYGLDPEVCLTPSLFDPNNPAEGERILLDTLHRHPDITAIVPHNDYEAMLVHDLLQRAGYRVPEDINLTGFDDIPGLPDAMGNNLLTTVRVPLRDIGERAARLCIKRITGEITHDETIMLPVELITRGSTTPPRTRPLPAH